MKYLGLFFSFFCVITQAQQPAPVTAKPMQINQGLPTLAPILKMDMPAIVNVAVQGVLPGLLSSNERNTAGPNDEQNPGPDVAPNQPKLPELPPRPRKFQSIGSGVIVDPKNGFILTNDHVIRHASLITITLNDGRRLKAKLIGEDGETDIAVLKIDAKNLKSLPIGNSDKAEVGDFVVAIGNPFGLNSYGNSQSATFGMVSALKRSDLNIEGVENFIQTDAAINPGNSGGALINTHGELIGINTAILSTIGGNVGIGFAIPINMAINVAQQIIRYGSVHRGLMGIFVQHLTPELAQAFGYSENFKGALISQVNEHSPAQEAGLKAGDIITQINDSPISQATQVKATVGLLRVGSEAKITVYRNGKPITLHAMVTDLKQQEQSLQSVNPFLFGLALRNFEQDAPMLGHVIGVQITGASENSPAWRAGLRPGDVIISANNQSTPNTQRLQEVVKEKKNQMLVQVIRDNGALFILII